MTDSRRAAEKDQPRLLHGFLARAARRDPERVAIEVPPGPGRPGRATLTYAELVGRSDAVAARLSRLVRGEAVVAIDLPRESPDLFVAQLGALKAGAAYTCLDAAFPAAHARFVLEDSGAAALLTDAAGAQRLGAHLDPERVVLVGGVPDAAPPPTPSWLSPASLAYVIYTSGTTGRPKGVEIEHGGIANLVGSDLETFRLTADDRVAQGSSPAYDSSVEETWLALAAGATLVVMDDDAARLGPDLVAWLRDERISVFCPPPTLLRATGCADPEAALPDLRLLYVGGEALPEDLADLWARGRWMENGYGPTECTVTVTRGRVRPGEPVSIGSPVRGHRAFVLGGDGDEVSDGGEGELCIAGPGLARGYRNQPELTARRFPTHPRFGRIHRTGDLVRRDADGNLFFGGRIDSQVKLRGYRIELEAVEARLAALPGVRAAACRVQRDDGAPALVAFVVPSRAEEPPAPADLAAALREELPAYMVPARFGVLAELPTTRGGKLDRRALPKLEVPHGARFAGEPPHDTAQARVAAAFEAALGAPVGVDDDFFLALGGDSLTAARVVSDLRADPRTASLTVRDVYERRTVAALARLIDTHEPRSSGAAAASAVAAPSRGSVAAATAVQAAVLLVLLCGGAALAYAIAFLALPWLLRALGIPLFLLVLPFAITAGGVAYAPVAVGAAVLSKKLLIGTYRPLRAPVWGSFFVRNWLVQMVVRGVPWGLLHGTVFQAVALRALGARIGRRVHIHRGVDLLRGGWDLLEIGDEATVSQDCELRLVELEAGAVAVGPVVVGAGATLAVRASVSAGAVVGDGAFLGALSWLRPGDEIPASRRWDGVPARPAGEAPRRDEGAQGRELPPWLHGVLLIGARLLSGFVAYAPLAAALAGLAWWCGTDADGVLAWLHAPTLGGVLPVLLALCATLPVSLVLSGLSLRLLGRVRPGAMHRFGAAYLRVWSKTSVVAAVGNWLGGTLFWPLWLRLAGMRVGRGCEISTIIDVVPECVSVGAESFFADGIYLGGPVVHRGVVTVGETRLGDGAFLGNHVVVPAGARMAAGVFVGVCTIADERTMPAGTGWFGHPPFELPRRAVARVDRRLTHDPTPLRRATRIFWETLRFALPVVPMLLFLGWFKAIAAAEGVSRVAVVPAATLGAVVSACLWVLALKWLLLGRVRPGEHPLWSCWCSRWDFLYVAWGRHARALLSLLRGTVLLAWYLRAMGARVGRAVVLGPGFEQVVDPDMLRIDDGATVSGMFQAHTFEDRVLKLGKVRIGRGATVSSGAVLFYGARLGEGTRVRPHGVVMKDEHVPAGRACTGCPTRQVALRVTAE